MRSSIEVVRFLGSGESQGILSSIIYRLPAKACAACEMSSVVEAKKVESVAGTQVRPNEQRHRHLNHGLKYSSA